MDTYTPVNQTTLMEPQKQQQNKRKKSSGKPVNKADTPPGTPVFLRKTFDMINTCDQTVASWYDNGKTFVVKDPERFAQEVIPEYFKHNKFPSFVRQLNFYGFRKIKADPLRIKDAATSEESKYWKFRHPNFQQGRPDLLSQIRKSQTETADKQEVEQLKKEIDNLKTMLDNLTDDYANLKTIVSFLVNAQGITTTTKMDICMPEPASKLRKLNDSTCEVQQPQPQQQQFQQQQMMQQPLQQQPFQVPSNGGVMDSSQFESALTPLPFPPGHDGLNNTNVSNIPQTPNIRSESNMSSLDDELLASLIALGEDSSSTNGSLTSGSTNGGGDEVDNLIEKIETQSCGNNGGGINEPRLW